MHASLECSLNAPANVRAGESVPLRFVVENPADSSIEVALGGRPAEQFRVTTAAGEPVWDSRAGQAILDILEARTIAPKERWFFDAVWDGRDSTGAPVRPGSYLIHARLGLEPPHQAEAGPREIRVTP